MKEIISWAIAGTGGISNRFVTGLKAARGGRLYAAVSRTKKNAEEFAARWGAEKSFDSFDAMLGDREVDAVYIGTPHPTHRDYAVKALKAGKAVLCEKPAAMNARELREMIAAARENSAFFMEAMWARFTPPVVKVREWLSQGLIGDVLAAQCNFGFCKPSPPEHRLFNPALGGGALLDAGIYPLSFVSMVFGGAKPDSITSKMYLGPTGVDEQTSVILTYGPSRMAFFSAALLTAMNNDAWIYGSGGKIRIPQYTFAHKAILQLDGRYDYEWQGDYISNGYNYEAGAVMDCMREGRIECPVMTWDESLRIMEIMDEIRRQNNLKYPGE